MIIIAYIGLFRYIYELNTALLGLTTFIPFAEINDNWSEITPHTIGPHGPAELIIKVVRFYKSYRLQFRQSCRLNLKRRLNISNQQSKLFIP